jgi:hypothetical protein
MACFRRLLGVSEPYTYSTGHAPYLARPAKRTSTYSTHHRDAPCCTLPRHPELAD